MELRETLKEVWQNRKKAVIGGVAAVLLLATGAGVVVWKKTTAPQQGVVEEVGDKVTVVTPEGVEVSFNKTLPPASRNLTAIASPTSFVPLKTGFPRVSPSPFGPPAIFPRRRKSRRIRNAS